MITFKTHSIVDVITNSSTTIFTWASGNSKAMVLELIDEVLAVAGSDKKAEDLYDVTVQVSDIESLIDELEDELRTDADDDRLLELFGRSDKLYAKRDWQNEEWKKSYRAVAKEIRDHVRENYQDEIDKLGNKENWMGFPPSTMIVVTRKDGEDTATDHILNNLFDADGGRDG